MARKYGLDRMAIVPICLALLPRARRGLLSRMSTILTTQSDRAFSVGLAAED